MKSFFNLSLVSVSLLVVSSGAIAAPSNAELQSEIQAIMAHDQKLQHEVHMLKAQLHIKQSHTVVYHHAVASTTAISNPNVSSAHSQVVAQASTQTTVTTASVAHPWTTRFGHALTVTTSPLTGNDMAGDASDILEQMSKQNQQLTLLQQQATFMNYLTAEGSDFTRPIIELSGGLEGQLYAVNGYNISSNPNGINLTTAQLDVNAMVSPWASGFMALNYSNAPISQGNRSPQATVYIDRGFMTLGNLNKFPVYFSMGEMYAPFGRYSGLMLTSPITESLGQIRSPTAVVGYSSNGIYASVYGYSGDQTSGGKDIIKQGGTDLGYKYLFGTNGGYSFDNGIGVVSNIADSQGLQDTGNPDVNEFQGFGANGGTANYLVHRVPAIDAHSTLAVGDWTGIAEFISTLGEFNPADLSYGSSVNGNTNITGAAPEALHVEVDYSWHEFAKPINFGVDYDHSWQALGAYLPQASYTGDISTSLFPNTLFTIEYRRDEDYSTSTVAGGGDSSPGAPVPAPTNTFPGTGQGRNTYLAQLGVYF